ncbi:adenylate/guanylate cyclase domain-containing protein [Spirulina sp. CS-785/01]|uniref:adenylate/guanylate cyclase domain-containing protein n=1 Tax=Spirulina sp. CS-785/01 TaxID=3021716 RepID=UPI00232FD47F|nr:adenylate/guanylate cyclase domain-containing protein [Spirulina sp. CS-785/01]MDB9314242.1 adenylate/guanylate cyclase domain-containing protein [Spirulina sp. CS-785/01]
MSNQDTQPPLSLPVTDALDAFFNLSPDLFCIRDAQGYFTKINPRWTEQLGWTEGELLEQPWIEFIHPDDQQATWERETELSPVSPPLRYKNRFRCKNGGYRWLAWRISQDTTGQSYGIAQDVTEEQWRKSAVYRGGVQEAVKLRDQAIAASRVGIVIADATLPDMPLIYVNPAFERITGYSPEEVLGVNCRFLQGKKTDPADLNRLRAAIGEGRHCTVTLLNYRKDGTPFWNELTISPIYDDARNLTHFVGIQADVSDRIIADKALRLEKHRSERLLLNILPKPIAEQLKKFQGTLAQQFDDVTILFADIVNFTPISSQMQPLELVTTLNQIFSTFDRMVDKYHLEKIKTIGDAYMVAGGLPLPQADHATAIAAMALEMQEKIQTFFTPQGQPFQLRIGLHTGSVVAGVIGIKKFIYDLWGDTVNVASRMESQGEVGKIQVSITTYELLKAQYDLEERGVISIKGKGEMTTYWLKGTKSSSLE